MTTPMTAQDWGVLSVNERLARMPGLTVAHAADYAPGGLLGPPCHCGASPCFRDCQPPAAASFATRVRRLCEAIQRRLKGSHQ